MNEELRGTIKTLQDIPLVKSGSYEFIGDSNITYADIYILLEFIRNQEQENKKYKEVINEMRNYLEARIEICVNRLSMPFWDIENTTKERLILSQCLEKLEELEVEHE